MLRPWDKIMSFLPYECKITGAEKLHSAEVFQLQGNLIEQSVTPSQRDETFASVIRETESKNQVGSNENNGISHATNFMETPSPSILVHQP